jgi:hypothetical protein
VSRHKHYTPSVPTDATLFDPPAQPVDSSIAAARATKPRTATQRGVIYEYLKTCGDVGATAGEIVTVLGLNPSTARPRLVELEGRAKWAPDLPRLVRKLAASRQGMRIYVVT